MIFLLFYDFCFYIYPLRCLLVYQDFQHDGLTKPSAARAAVLEVAGVSPFFPHSARANLNGSGSLKALIDR